jgi:membrane protein
MGSLIGRVRSAVRHRREAWPWFDHLARAGSRYKADGGDRLSAALTMYAIFALLPLLLVAMSVLGYVIANDPERQRTIFLKISGALPGVGRQLSDTLSTVKANRGTTGLLGLLGLAFSGLGGVDALRDALRIMWHQDTAAGNILKKKATDLLTVLLVGVTLAVSFGVSALATGGAGALLNGAGIDGALARGVLYVLSFGVGVLVDAALFLVLFKWLPRVDWPLRRLVRGALFGGVMFGLLKLVGGWYVGRTATRSTALYGSIGTAVALLVGLYLLSRVILFTAAWTVTAPGWDDVEPSGTASPEAARAAGLPESAAGGTQGVRGSQGSRGDRAPLPVGAAATRAAYAGPSAHAQRQTVLAARAVQGFAATLVAAIGWRGLRSLRRS